MCRHNILAVMEAMSSFLPHLKDLAWFSIPGINGVLPDLGFLCGLKSVTALQTQSHLLLGVDLCKILVIILTDQSLP
jgi:hypothetical protein